MASQVHHWHWQWCQVHLALVGFSCQQSRGEGCGHCIGTTFHHFLPHSHLYYHLNKAAGPQGCHHICGPSSLHLWDNMGPNNVYLCESFLLYVWPKLIALRSGSSEHWIQVSTGSKWVLFTCILKRAVLMDGACLDPPYFFFFLSLFVYGKPSVPPWPHSILQVWYYNTNVFSMANGGGRATMKWCSEVSWPRQPLFSI